MAERRSEGEKQLAPPFDISRHFSWATKSRPQNRIKKFYKYFQIPGIAQLAGGLPDYNFFPFDTLEGSAAQPDRYRQSSSNSTGRFLGLGGPQPSNPQPAQVVVPKVTEASSLLKEIDLKTALQYGTAQGYPPLYTWLRNFAVNHLQVNTPYKDGPGIILTCGNTDGLDKTLQAVVNPWVEGRDPIEQKPGLLLEEFIFTAPISNAKPRGMNIVPVAFDEEGMIPHGPKSLEDVLENWDFSKGRRPHVMYLVTFGDNPSGGVQSVERRKAIYALCVKYDILIIEDEPYWYLQYPKSNETPMHTMAKDQKSTGYPFLDSLVPSYLSIDYEGRVVRLDTFSKTVAPGCRLGWITAQPALVERLERITEVSTQQPSGFVQSMISELLMGPQARVKSQASESKAWDISGWVMWLEGLRDNYQRRMEIMHKTLTEGQYLVKTGRRPSLSALSLDERGNASSAIVDDDDDSSEWGVVERTHMFRFNRPAGGMFLWLELLIETHPLAKRVDARRLAIAFWSMLTRPPYLVLAGPGSIFAATDEIRQERGHRFMRLCFASIDDETVAKASKGFTDGAAAFWRIKDEEEIDRLLKDLDDDGPFFEQLQSGAGQMIGMPGFC